MLKQNKSIKSGYYLTCKVTVYALRDYLGGAYVEFTNVTSANIVMGGDAISSEWVGSAASISPWLASGSRLNVNYYGYIEFRLTSSQTIKFGTFVGYSTGTSDTKIYHYDCDGQFVFNVSKITSYK